MKGKAAKGKGKGKGGGKGSCHHCGEYGHIKSTCPRFDEVMRQIRARGGQAKGQPTGFGKGPWGKGGGKGDKGSGKGMLAPWLDALMGAPPPAPAPAATSTWSWPAAPTPAWTTHVRHAPKVAPKTSGVKLQNSFGTLAVEDDIDGANDLADYPAIAPTTPTPPPPKPTGSQPKKSTKWRKISLIPEDGEVIFESINSLKSSPCPNTRQHGCAMSLPYASNNSEPGGRPIMPMGDASLGP